jgi:hypothetical protein
MSDYFTMKQVVSGYIMLIQVRNVSSGYARLGLLGQFRSGFVRLCQVWLSQVRSG